VAALTVLAVLAAGFWTLLLGHWAGSGFQAEKRQAANPAIIVTRDCAWPYDASHPNAEAVCRLFYDLTPEQRAEVLKARSDRTAADRRSP
jgi:hypothetical protein